MTGSTIAGDHMAMSPITNAFVAIFHYLDSHGYRDLPNIPGYRYLVALQPLKRYVDPFLNFVSSHRTLACIVTLLHLWMAAELIFYIMFWKKLARLQEIDRVVKGIKLKERRKELFQRCLETVNEGDGVKRWVEVWFDTGRTKQRARFEEIGRLNMIHWLAWAFWAAPFEEVSNSPANLQEMNEMIDTIEEVKKVKFEEGFNSNIDCIRLCLDPVLASHRPLVYYILLWFANALADLVFWAIGLTKHDITLNVTSDNDSRKVSREVSDLSYWYRSPVNPKNKVPLVFVQGIGIGLVQYIHFIVALTRISRPLMVIEVPYVSNRLLQTDCMTPDETYFAIEHVLKLHGHTTATFMGHSLGTMLCAAVCRANSATSQKSIVVGLILVDPICFLTHHSIAHNFAYRTPATASQLVMDLFASREIGTSWYIMRRFCWNQCVMFPIAWAKRHQKPLLCQGLLSPVLPEKTRVFLSENDNLMDMSNVAEYLKTQVGLVAQGEGKEGSELVVMKNLDHAQFLLQPHWFSSIIQAAHEC
ncbi:hypothetical protein BGZ65_001064 [Modicella reniformis]|uniref:AB hydrolase-1 domain-containing protein n=1 Tax=Modicella reniformis TaxID=1440133 RepID=A0A9P6MJ90_9FUNG|nr:hypothetical protein BGZ65_001064 [Modicella reniformis]